MYAQDIEILERAEREADERIEKLKKWEQQALDATNRNIELAHPYMDIAQEAMTLQGADGLEIVFMPTDEVERLRSAIDRNASWYKSNDIGQFWVRISKDDPWVKIHQIDCQFIERNRSEYSGRTVRGVTWWRDDNMARYKLTASGSFSRKAVEETARAIVKFYDREVQAAIEKAQREIRRQQAANILGISKEQYDNVGDMVTLEEMNGQERPQVDYFNKWKHTAGGVRCVVNESGTIWMEGHFQVRFSADKRAKAQEIMDSMMNKLLELYEDSHTQS